MFWQSWLLFLLSLWGIDLFLYFKGCTQSICLLLSLPSRAQNLHFILFSFSPSVCWATFHADVSSCADSFSLHEFFLIVFLALTFFHFPVCQSFLCSLLWRGLCILYKETILTRVYLSFCRVYVAMSFTQYN